VHKVAESSFTLFFR